MTAHVLDKEKFGGDVRGEKTEEERRNEMGGTEKEGKWEVKPLLRYVGLWRWRGFGEKVNVFLSVTFY